MEYVIVGIAMFVFTILSMCFGYDFLDIMQFWDQEQTAAIIKNSLSYCIGIFIILFLYRFIERILRNAKLALILTAVFMLGMLLYKGKTTAAYLDVLLIKNFSSFTAFIITGVFVAILYYAHHLYYNVENISIWTSIGSAHSYRIGNIALFIKNNNRIPIVAQNYAQSLIASIFEMIGINYSNLIIFLFSVISMTQVIFFYAGLLTSIFALKGFLLLIGTIFIVFGGETINKRIRISFDSGASDYWLIIGYPDTAISMGLMFYMNLKLLSPETWNCDGTLIATGIMLCLCAYVWNITSAHLIILQLGYMLFYLAQAIFFHAFIKEYAILTLAFAMIAYIGRLGGGLFAPKKKVHEMDGALNIGGILKLNGFAVYKKGVPIITGSISNIFQVLFFPLVTYVFTIILVAFKVIPPEMNLIFGFGLFSIILMLGGFIIIYPFASGNGHKHEINRFIAPACISSRILFVAEAAILLDQITDLLIRIIIGAVLISIVIYNIFCSNNLFIRIKSSYQKVFCNPKLKEELQLLSAKTSYITNDTKDAPPFLALSDSKAYLELQMSTKQLLEQRNRPFILYGADKTGKIRLEMLRELKINVLCFSDGNRKKWNTNLSGLMVIEPERIKEMQMKDQNIIILITSHKFFEIYNQLREREIQNVRIYTF